MFYLRSEDLAVNFRIVTVGIMISQLYDLIWLYNYFTVRNIQKWLGGGLGEEICVLVSLINFGAKFVFGAVFWKNSIDLS
jgi:hypothetical protein